MRTADLDYDLPPPAIAQTPIEPRDAARLLVDRGPDAPVEHRHVRDLPDLLQPGDLVVVNDTKVLPGRLRLRRASGGAVEVLLLERLDAAGHDWEALVRPSRKLATGEIVIDDANRLAVEVGAPSLDGTRLVRILADDPLAAIDATGEMPLPPYITVPLRDRDRYQTVYAERAGASAAAPTAGLHVTQDVLARLARRGIDVVRVELVVGLDTFKPLAVDDPAHHRMHTEAYRVDPDVLERCHAARANGGRVVAIGTTATRALESAVTRGPCGRTDLFIRRPYAWQLVDVLLTNFHLPRTTLLLMIDAFIGSRWRTLYETALDNGYRFLSFGDAMLLERRAP